MEEILITEMSSTVAGRSLRNCVAWRLVNGNRVMLAMGAPAEWHSPEPLPPAAVVTDLLAVSVDDPPLARQLWGAFLGYLASSQVPRWHFVLPRFMRPALPVRVQLPEEREHSAVRSAIQGVRGPLRFKVYAT